MPLAASQMSPGHDVIAMLDDAVSAVESLFADARRAVSERVTIEGRMVSRVFDREQRATHGLAWLATYVEALRQLAAYAQHMTEMGSFGETEELLVRIGAGEYLAQITGGIPMSQGEIVRLSDLGLSASAAAARISSIEVTPAPALPVRSRPIEVDDFAAMRRAQGAPQPILVFTTRMCHGFRSRPSVAPQALVIGLGLVIAVIGLAPVRLGAQTLPSPCDSSRRPG